MKLQIWDTAGTETFRAVAGSYFRGALIAIIVFDVTREESFYNVRNWWSNTIQLLYVRWGSSGIMPLTACSGEPGLIVILAATQVDNTERVVSFEQGSVRCYVLQIFLSGSCKILEFLLAISHACQNLHILYIKLA